ncbi:MAG: phosphatidylglycerophosphatase A [Polyangiaceae bacterium]|nr:phosphatidylglycerophosphatase A [Polyangiaceae bacterium]
MPAPIAARALATWFGCGLSPKAPGTVGSIGTLPLYFGLKLLPWPAYLAAVVVLTGLGVWASQRYAEAAQEEDPQRVVIDEVVGTLLALGMVASFGIVAEACAFVLFRLLDITKPGPIDTVQNLKPVGVGVMADDVLAGLGAGALTYGFATLLHTFTV